MLSAAAPTRVAPARARATRMVVQARAATSKITVVRQPSEEVLKSRGVRSWPTWGCGVSKFPWTYQESETCYVLEGHVIVTPNGGGEPVEIKAGDMATFPAGLSCVWDVKAPINKHYEFH